VQFVCVQFIIENVWRSLVYLVYKPTIEKDLIVCNFHEMHFKINNTGRLLQFKKNTIVFLVYIM
jgi:hypothetical protein